MRVVFLDARARPREESTQTREQTMKETIGLEEMSKRDTMRERAVHKSRIYQGMKSVLEVSHAEIISR
jgi:hypothetical protein